MTCEDGSSLEYEQHVWILTSTKYFYQSPVIQHVCCYVYITWPSMEKSWRSV